MISFKNLKGDLFGGLTAGIVALPLALAFGASTELGATAGLYGAIFISFFAALFGGTPTQISGPTAPMTALSFVIITSILASMDGNISEALPIILGVFMLAGLFQIALGVFGIGKYIKYIPYPVVSGFMTAIGIMILIGQIAPSVGYDVKEDTEFVETFKPHAEEKMLDDILKDESKEGILVIEHFEETIKRAASISDENIMKEAKSLAKDETAGVIGSVMHLPRVLSNIKWLELLLAIGTIVIIYGFKRITTVVPSTLVALLVMSGLAIFFFGQDYKSISTIPSGFPTPNFKIFTKFDFVAIMPYVLSAMSLAFLGAIDSLLTSVVADNMTKTKHKPNKELIGQGIGNTIGALFGGLPGAGATIRTVVNINSGGKTNLSGMFTGVVLLIVLLVLGPIASKIPVAVLAGILITVGFGVMDYKGLKAIPKMPKAEVIIMVVVCLISLKSLIIGVGIGLLLASIIFMKNIGDIASANFKVKKISDDEHWSDEHNFPEKLREEVYIKHIGGPLFFGSTSEFTKLIDDIPETAEYVIIRMDRCRYMDQSGLYAFEDVLIDLTQQGVKILIIHLNEQPKMMLERVNLVPSLVPENQIFDEFENVVIWINKNVKNKF
jgi:SulP family sulfate permease